MRKKLEYVIDDKEIRDRVMEKYTKRVDSVTRGPFERVTALIPAELKKFLEDNNLKASTLLTEKILEVKEGRDSKVIAEKLAIIVLYINKMLEKVKKLDTIFQSYEYYMKRLENEIKELKKFRKVMVKKIKKIEAGVEELKRRI